MCRKQSFSPFDFVHVKCVVLQLGRALAFVRTQKNKLCINQSIEKQLVALDADIILVVLHTALPY